MMTTLTVWARTGGGQNAFRLEVKAYGGPDLVKDRRGASGGSCTRYPKGMQL
ncbi:hypothetical protein ACVNS2_22860 [Paenibacillus caseinilyticus]|uniref:Uncharacterized protein n=1 Tax=Paenibacillus mucilaginosus K02 TaxID=997761 RepID=I0BME9_9BACL|nr:hypothetical protein [Paenibacillus mucilaginosus]AFH63546.2 hypothetical protein B2K_39765 [Paenibacillus mucilaginosus K02]